MHVGNTLTANTGTWSPAPTFAYQWRRNGTAISGATAKTYAPIAADIGQPLTVTVTGTRSGYTTTSRTSAATARVPRIDGDGDGIDDFQDLMPWDSDVNADGRPDIVGFADGGIYVALNNGRGFGPSTRWSTSFGAGTASGGWQVGRHPRALVDVNGDTRPDVVGFAEAGVVVALNTGRAFAAPKQWTSGFRAGAGGGWRVERHPRTLVDVNGDGRVDVVGFAEAGVEVGLNTGSSFARGQIWLNDFGATAGGWRSERHPRHLVDVNGDGRPDVVGFGEGGVVVALNTGRAFAAARTWTTGFRAGSGGGWRVERHPRELVDVNGDGRPDVVGFAEAGVFVGINTGSGFAAGKQWSTSFGAAAAAGGWQVSRHPRVLADVNGDSRPDVVGFAEAGVVVAINTGQWFADEKLWTGGFGAGPGGWRVASHPRTLADMNGDGRVDVVGFANAGLAVGLNTGTSFGAGTVQLTTYGASSAAGGWVVDRHPRFVSAPRYTFLPGSPRITGAARVGSRLTATVTGPLRATNLRYQWRRAGAAIPNATGRTYVPTAADRGRALSVTVTALRPGHAAVRRTSGTRGIGYGALAATTPSLSGKRKAGATLRVRPGTWTPGTRLTYRWYAAGTRLKATGNAYRVPKRLGGKRVHAQVIGSKAGYATRTTTTAKVRIRR